MWLPPPATSSQPVDLVLGGSGRKSHALCQVSGLIWRVNFQYTESKNRLEKLREQNETKRRCGPMKNSRLIKGSAATKAQRQSHCVNMRDHMNVVTIRQLVTLTAALSLWEIVFRIYHNKLCRPT